MGGGGGAGGLLTAAVLMAVVGCSQLDFIYGRFPAIIPFVVFLRAN